MNTESALILGIAIVLSALTKFFYHVRPRRAVIQATLTGLTDSDGENIQLTTTLFADETAVEWNKKLRTMFEIRGDRLQEINNKMLQAIDRSKVAHEDLKVQRAEARENVAQIKKN